MSGTSPATPRVRIVAAAAALALIGGGVAIAVSRGGSNEPLAQPPGPISPGGSSASCVEMYSLQTLAPRAVAFDGTVSSVDGDEVTFTVGESFRGVEGSAITLKGAAVLGGTTSAGEGLALAPGTRLLVAGDGGFAWACGFTQPYDPAVAADWRATFDG